MNVVAGFLNESQKERFSSSLYIDRI
jgi:hypothetical protein